MDTTDLDTFQAPAHLADLVEAAEELDEHMRVAASDLSQHFTVGEAMSVARTLWAAGHADTARALAEAMIHGDSDVAGTLTTTDQHHELRLFRDGLDEEAFYLRRGPLRPPHPSRSPEA